MDGQDIVFESIFKVEKVKEETHEFFQEANPLDLVPPVTVFVQPTKVLNEEVEGECEELEPPVTVFLESAEVIKEEVEEECEDPLETYVERCPIKTEETDERSSSPGE
ncbi:hypothetical protein R5R35_004660 [Gryllus longicercus]|uniref:Uncharacterized protein n=1 Tax=Gryllus longicercus TaxID=2509291 RepID=A0AAN9W0W3_9ORTH